VVNGLDLARDVVDRPLLFPCGISQLKRTVDAFFLDERPERRDWVLVGCERSQHGADCMREDDGRH
jgi:hypothetical protein